MLSKLELIQKFYQMDVIKFGQFQFKSGATSNLYLDLRMIISDPKVLASIADLCVNEIKHFPHQNICGVPYTALPIATAVSISANIPMLMVRKEQKDYGTKKMIEGKVIAEQNVVVLEDVITSGGSVQSIVEILRAERLRVSDVVVVIDREQGAVAKLAAANLKVHALFTLSQILQTINDHIDVLPAERNIIRKLLLLGEHANVK